MRKFLFTVLVSLCAGTLYGQQVEDIILSDGSVLSGYIYKQRPGKDMIVFAEKAEICLPFNCVLGLGNKEVNVATLSDKWKEWCEANPNSVKDSKEGQLLQMSSFRVKSTAGAVVRLGTHLRDAESLERLGTEFNVESVRLLEKGDRFRYVDLTPAYYSISLSSVKAIKRSPRKKTDLSGIIDIIETESETFEGQVTGQIPGQFILLDTEYGIIEAISSNRIISQKRKPLNQQQTLWEQSRFIDVISGQNNISYKGILIEQNYGKTNVPGFVLIQDKDGNIHHEETKNITSISKELNSDYKLIEDVILKEGELRINGEEAVWIDIESLYLLRSSVDASSAKQVESVLAVTLPTDIVTVKLADTKQVVLDLPATNSDAFRMVPMIPGTSDKKKENNVYYTFTYEEYFRGVNPTSKNVSPNNTLHLEFEVCQAGIYAIYDPSYKKVAALCKVE